MSSIRFRRDLAVPPVCAARIDRIRGAVRSSTGLRGWAGALSARAAWLSATRVRLLEIIGEAANSLSEEFRAQHPAIPWRDIIGLRVVLAHHYHQVDPGQVWAIAATEVPRLVQDLRLEG